MSAVLPNPNGPREDGQFLVICVLGRATGFLRLDLTRLYSLVMYSVGVDVAPR
ncbi:MAG: hypothetical protein ACRDSH_05280 [Pseudonocardiaceae bacterium]